MKTEPFEDFYALLGVSPTASSDEIRRAFRARMRVWHPDVNKSPDATATTQRLIVAYKILNDVEARSHYDAEYSTRARCASETRGGQKPQPESQQAKPQSANQAPEPAPRTSSGFEDPELDRWVRMARREATEEWKKFTEEFKNASKAAGTGAVQGLKMVLIYIVVSFIAFLIIAAFS